MGVAGGLRMQAVAGHPFSTNIAFNFTVGTREGLQESKCRVTMLIGVRGRGMGAENAGGSRAPF